MSILDLRHLIPRLWDCAHCFRAEGSQAAREFIDLRLTRLLTGDVSMVVAGLRQMGTKRQLLGSKQRTLAQATQYLYKSRHRMKYDEYLAAGYPIGTGPVEGACRYVVKDRFQRSGMRWCIPGAKAMLALRTTHLNDDWEASCQFRTQRHTESLYPQRQELIDALN